MSKESRKVNIKNKFLPLEVIYPDNYESKIGFDRIRSQIEALCTTQGAIDKLSNTQFGTDKDVIQRLLEQTFEMRTILMMEGEFAGRGFVDTRDSLRKIEVDGTFLETEEIANLRKALALVAELLAFFRSTGQKYPRLTALSAGIESFPEIISRIDSIIDSLGKIKDNASPELYDVRKRIRDNEAQISRRLHQIMNQAQSAGIVDSDATISIREGRAVIPVSAANKRKLKGFIHDESATGKTFYIEPIEVVEINNELKELEYEERREVIRILVNFTEFLRPSANDIARSGEYLTTIDFICAKGRHAVTNNCTLPILALGTQIDLRNGRHTLLQQTLQRESKSVVPLNLTLTPEKHILLISGPNAGGKSVCLKTVGLLQYMLQCGVLVSVSENSEMGIFESIFIDIGDEQSIDNDLSTYSSHLINMKNILRHANNRSLVLIDEFGTGTEPAIGGAIAEAVLEKLVEKGCFGVITTHYSNLKYYAGNAQGVVNGAMMFDVQNIQPLFSLDMGKPGSSFAVEIARKIGLPEEIIRSASAKVGSDHMNIERQLREISRDRQYWEQKRTKIHQTEKRIEEQEAKYRLELENIRAERSRVLKEAKTEAQKITSDANKQIENTIRTIKESQADKTSTLIVRRQLDEFRDSLHDSYLGNNISDSEMERKIAKLKERERQRQERKVAAVEPAERETKADLVKPPKIEVGVKVRIMGQQAVGEVMAINGKRADVAFGQMKTTIEVAKLESISNSEFKKVARSSRPAAKQTNFNASERRANFSTQIDLRGMRAAEALEATQEFIDDAYMLGYPEVRILHGKGTGALKEEIRKYLGGLNYVRSATDEHVEMGGAGITVVNMKV